MTQTELLADALGSNLEFLKSLLADFSDADLMVRPCPKANHAAWQLGHLIASETQLVCAAKGTMPELPAGFAERFNKQTASIDDPAAFPKKAELIGLFEKTRAGTVKWARGLTEKDLARPMEGDMKEWVPTVWHLAGMLPVHTAMHAGQIQVIRRKLGKPVLF